MSKEYINFTSNILLDLGLHAKVKKTLLRRTITLSIKNDSILIAVPSYFSNEAIDKLIEKKINWIKNKVRENDSSAKKKKINFMSGDKVFLYGAEVILDVIKGKTTKIILSANIIKIFLGRKNANTKYALETWYKKKSFDYTEKRTNYLSNAMCLKYRSVKVRNFKSRLGSCSIKGDIVLNWRIIMFPKEVIDYIIIHELSHIIHFNHSKLFWNTVKKFCPKFKEHKLWLKKNSQMITW